MSVTTGIQGRRGVDPHSRSPRTRSPATPSFPMPAVSRYPLSMSNMPFKTAYLEPLRKPAMHLRDSDLFPIFAKKWFAFSLVLDITFETNHPVDCHQAERGYNQAAHVRRTPSLDEQPLYPPMLQFPHPPFERPV